MNDMVTFTEAPYLYRRQDAEGNYFGDYYLFYATHWREEMGYARSTDITSNKWTHGGVIMEPTATSDTNHPAIFNFRDIPILFITMARLQQEQDSGV